MNKNTFVQKIRNLLSQFDEACAIHIDSFSRKKKIDNSSKALKFYIDTG